MRTDLNVIFLKEDTMRTIAIEEHFLAEGFREAMKRNTGGQAGASTQATRASVEEELSNLDTLRLKHMDAGDIDVQVISHTVIEAESLSASELVRLAQAANDQLAAAVAAHPDRFAGFATLPMADPEAAADELERAVR